MVSGDHQIKDEMSPMNFVIMCGQIICKLNHRGDIYIILKGTGVPRISCPRGTLSPRIKCPGDS